MAKSSHVIKLSKNMKPYVGRVVRNGPIQQAFAEKMKNGNLKSCMGSIKGQIGTLSGAAIHAKAKACVEQALPKNSTIGGSEFIHGKGTDARLARARKRAGAAA
jgi:hypothetical protein